MDYLEAMSVNAKILYIDMDMDNVLVDFPSDIDQLPKELVAQYGKNLDEVPAPCANVT